MVIASAPVALAIGAGSLVGLVLGLVGAGGSILAVPLLAYIVGVASPHVAIGTGAVAVAANALTGLAAHARARTVKWRCAGVFAVAGLAGTQLGAAAGKATDGEALLAAFGLAMIGVGAAMLRGRRAGGDPDVRLTATSAGRLLPRLLAGGFGVGLLSGFFGIGGGFLIVPALITATGMPIRQAVGTSLVAVALFGLSTAASYAASGYVDWPVAGLFILGGIAGGVAGTRANAALGSRQGMLGTLFGGLVVIVGLMVAGRGLLAL